MDFNDYQTKAASTASYPGSGKMEGLTYAVLGLTNEAGEVAGKLKKVIRDNAGVISPDIRKKILDELGDTLWYAAMVARELDMDLNGVADMNLDKLADRKERGVIQGSGDNR